MDDIKIKACNPDNGMELSQLVAVFRDSYGDQFPFRGVYDADYWARNIGARLISVVALKKYHVVAHIAARPEYKNSQVVQLCFPACGEALQQRAIEVTNEAWGLLRGIAARQNWSAVYYASFSDIEIMQRIGLESFGTTTTAILPGYVPIQNPRCLQSRVRNSRNGSRSHVVVGQRLLDNTARHAAPLFVPKQHLEMIKSLFLSVGMTGASLRLNTTSAPENITMPTDAPALHSRIFKDWGAAHYIVRPSLLSGFEESLFEVSRAQGARSFIFVDARDPACPSYSNFLEESGYTFSGILPNLFGTESLVYSQSDEALVDAESFLCPVAKRLARYISEQEPARASLPQAALLKTAPKYATARS